MASDFGGGRVAPRPPARSVPEGPSPRSLPTPPINHYSRCKALKVACRVAFLKRSVLPFYLILPGSVLGFGGQILPGPKIGFRIADEASLPIMQTTSLRAVATTSPSPAAREAARLVRNVRVLSALRWRSALRGVCWGVIVALLLLAGGCAELRLPAIDPTGNCLFAPGTASTTLAHPSLLGPDGCLSGIGCRSCMGRPGGCLSCLHGILPEPAFRDPPPPPPCLQGQAPGSPTQPPRCVPGAPYSEDCAAGPPAVMIGEDCHVKDFLHLPKKGKRGRLMLSPNRVVAPVGGEVVLLSGVCGNDGFLATGEPIEWMLTPDSVGHFIEIAPDDASLLQRMANQREVDKVSGSFARGLTRTKPALITRGTIRTNDDVPLEAGQAWATISSPSEGVSRITALAPESDCWDQRRATTTIYWVDARWRFPAPQIARAGDLVALTTRVTRSEGTIPAVGWKVRYTILTPELAGFAPSGAATVEAIVDDAGNAVATLQPVPGTSGMATIAMEVIRPAGVDADVPELTLGSGQTLVTWSAPRLELRAGAPSVASFDQPVTVFANVSNPGDLPTGKVQVSTVLPEGVRFVGSDFDYYESGNQIIWTYEDGIPPGVQGDINLTVTSRNPFRLEFQARDLTSDLFATAEVRVDVFIPSLQLEVKVAEGRERITVGEDTQFLIDVTNTGSRPLSDVQLQVSGDGGMSHVQEGSPTVFKTKEDGPLAPGATWSVATDFNVFEPGQRCVSVSVTASGGQRAEAQACVTATNPIPATPAVISEIAGRPEVRVGDEALFRYFVQNPGRIPLTNVEVTATYSPQLELLSATEGFDAAALGQYQIKWRLARVDPGQRMLLEGLYRVVGPTGAAEQILTVRVAEGATDESRFDFRVVAGVPRPQEPPPVAPPPVGVPAPTIPDAGGGLNAPPLQGGPADAAPAPGTAAPGTAAPGTAAPPLQNGPGELQLSVFDSDDPVTVGQPIRYTIRLTNPTALPDSQVQIRFALSDQLRLRSIRQTVFPGEALEREAGGYFYLREISELRAGETIEYTLILDSNSPQTGIVQVEAYSRRQPTPVSDREETRIDPQ